MSLTELHRRQLLDVAAKSIDHGLRHGTCWPVALNGFDPELREIRATFVTLEMRGHLRGCIGTLEPHWPLVEDVSRHAFAAAFEDTRFMPVSPGERPDLEIHISILSPARPLPCEGERDLISKLKAGVHGLILDDGRRRATFLPSVWEDLDNPAEFVRHLKQKGGWSDGQWPRAMQAFVYETESIP